MQVAVKNRLQQMDDYDFEHFVADLWERMGWKCKVSQASVDAGIDVVATKSNPYQQKKLIQAKRYGPNTTVGGPDIQQYASLKHQQPGVDSVVVVTTNSFTRAAEERAQELNVKLVDGDALVSMIDDMRAEDLIAKYSSGAADIAGPHTVTQDTQPGGNSTSLENKDGFLSNISEKRSWNRILVKSTGSAFVFQLAGGFLLDTGNNVLGAIGSLFAFVVTVLAIVVVVSLYLDIRYVRRHSSWNPTTWQYLLGLLIPYVTLPIYFYRRHKTIGAW